MIQAHDRPKHLMAFPADVPPMAVRHLRDQTTHVQPLQHPTDRVALATAFPGLPLIICGSLKIAYDLSLLYSFRHIRPPEERPSGA